MTGLALDPGLLGSIIVGPGLFILGCFFVMQPFLGVRIFGVVLMTYTALAGDLYNTLTELNAFLVFAVLAVGAMSAGAYLNYHLTTRRIKKLIEDSKAQAREGKAIVVPYAKDGTWFHPGLVYSDGRYRVGPKGSEHATQSYQAALAALSEMPIACWRRPSTRSGLLGMVSATHWAAPPDHAQRKRFGTMSEPPQQSRTSG